MGANGNGSNSSQGFLGDCARCKTEKRIDYPDSHFLSVIRNEPALLCAACATNPEERTVPVEVLQPIFDHQPLGHPITGALQPISAAPDESNSGARQYWMEIGHMVLETMATWGDKVLKFSFGGNRYKGLWLKPHWESSRVAGFTMAGDTPSKNLELDVYQIHRLKSLGLAEEGQKNKSWSIHLTEPEGTITNASAAIIHILRFGYLLEPGDMYSFTPTLDIDFSESD